MRWLKHSVVISCLVLMVFALVQCNSKTGKPAASTQDFSPADVVKGHALAANYCKSCHQLPDPSLLDKKTWGNDLLPVMGTYLGIKRGGGGNLQSMESDESYLPSQPVVDSATWAQIKAYYITKAPERLPAPNRPTPIHQLPIFDIQPAPVQWALSKTLASYVKIDESVKPHRMIVCDGLNNKLIILDENGQTLKSNPIDGPVVDLLFQNSKITATTIGQNLWANNFKNGFIKEIAIDKSGTLTQQPQPIFYKLGRPLSVQIVDLNGDGKKDYLVAQFGKMEGRLSWVEKLPQGLKEHVLRDKPGCIKTIITKGKNGPDIWALFAQGDEGIFHYTNDGKGNFTETELISFPPSYGSSSFDLVDFNGDGHKDIIYTCGDNGDYSQILKPYHGLYIYLNDGNDHFSKKYFYPINGCYKAIAKDFDGDGDLDIATISNYPGAGTPWESFIYFENKGNFNFQTYTMPVNTPFHNGTTMDVGDIDGDGKPDILLGNGYFAKDTTRDVKQPLFIVLKNKSKGFRK